MIARNRWSRSILLAVAMVFGTAAMPMTAAADDVEWTYQGKNFRLQIPAGFCVPTGKMETFAEELRFLDRVNDTHLVLTNCDATDQAERWVVLKSPKNITGNAVPSRGELLREAKKMNLPALETFVDDVGKEAGSDFGRELEQMVGETTSVRPVLKPLAIDDIAIYIGGFITYQVGAEEDKVSTVWSTTVLNNTIFYLYRYKFYESAADIGGLLEHIEKETRVFLADN